MPVNFKGGDRLKAHLAGIAARVSKAQEVSVGFLENAKYPDGTQVAAVAAIQEYGAPAVGIPPRPFFRTMIAAKSQGWGDSLGRVLVAADYDATQALGMMGEGIKGQLQESIVDVVGPPLSPITLMLRKMRSEDQTLVVTGKTVAEAAARVAAGESAGGVSAKPLVDTGHLLASVDYEVKGS